MNDLSDKKCVPCQGGEPILEKTKIQEYLDQIDSGWKHQNDPDKIVREFKFDDFESAMSFVNDVASIAEEEDHHPNIYIHDYNQVKIEFWTHKINGLHENDFIMASKIEKLL